MLPHSSPLKLIHVSGQLPIPITLPRRQKIPVPIEQKPRWATKPFRKRWRRKVCRVAEVESPPAIRFTELPLLHLLLH